MLPKLFLPALCAIFASLPFALGHGPGATGGGGGGGAGGGTGGGTGGAGGGAGGAPGGGTGSGSSITAVLAATADLSTLSSILVQYPGLIANLSGTLLAPSNSALEQYITSAGGLSALTPAAISDLLSYHVLPSTYSSSDLSRSGGRLVDTSLRNPALANLEGAPQVVFASAYGSTGVASTPSDLRIYSGVGTPANVTRGDIPYEGGVIHVIDRWASHSFLPICTNSLIVLPALHLVVSYRILNIPQTCTKTADTARLTTLLAALQHANLTDTVDTVPKFTCFAPTDEAFQRAGINVTALTQDQLVDALKYHSIVGEVGYSTALEDGKEYQTLLGLPVKVSKRDGKFFINEAEVLTGNVIMPNGVAQVLNTVRPRVSQLKYPQPNHI